MIIGGLVKFSLNDYPGKTSAVIFTRDCNFRCGYCHNPELVLPAPMLRPELKKYVKEIPSIEVFSFLESRKGKLDAVVITGGEPTQHSDLAEFIKKIKDMGFLVKLDTNGTRPLVVKDLINQKLIDYIAMDIKAPLDPASYQKVSKMPFDTSKIEKSVALIINSGLPHEFRTTVVKSLTSFDDLRKIAESIKGAQNYFLQKFVPAAKLNDSSFINEISYPEEELKKLAAELTAFVKHCSVR
ncbi:MAG: anaerobic ribonucleoside-triphosphate reductase activating protein [Candidatus Zambryskibacteria bacterium]